MVLFRTRLKHILYINILLVFYQLLSLLKIKVNLTNKEINKIPDEIRRVIEYNKKNVCFLGASKPRTALWITFCQQAAFKQKNMHFQ